MNAFRNFVLILISKDLKAASSKYEYKYNHGLILKNVMPSDSGNFLFYDPALVLTPIRLMFRVYGRSIISMTKTYMKY